MLQSWALWVTFNILHFLSRSEPISAPVLFNKPKKLKNTESAHKHKQAQGYILSFLLYIS